MPRTVFNRFYIFFAIIRAMYLAFVVALKVVFYCHHPDYVQTPHNSLLKIL